MRFKKLLALCDILMRRHPAAIFEGLVHDAYNAPIPAVDNKVAGFPLAMLVAIMVQYSSTSPKKEPLSCSVDQKLPKGQARFYDRGRNLVQFYVAAIAKDDPARRIEHH